MRLTDRAARLTRRAVRQTYRDGSERNGTQRMKNALVWGGPKSKQLPWGREEQESFSNAKAALVNATTLKHPLPC